MLRMTETSLGWHQVGCFRCVDQRLVPVIRQCILLRVAKVYSCLFDCNANYGLSNSLQNDVQRCINILTNRLKMYVYSECSKERLINTSQPEQAGQ